MQKASLLMGLGNPAASVALWAIVAVLTVGVSLAEVAWVLVLGWADRQRRIPHALSSLWGRMILMLVTAGRIRVIGRRHLASRKAAILIANHQSLLDIMALYALGHQFKWVAKAELFGIPFLGWSMRASGYLQLVRGRHGSIRDAYDRARRCLSEGMSVLFFPEGTRSQAPEMLPFKNGAFKLALESGMSIIPVAVQGTRDLLVRGSWRFRLGGAVRISVLEPLDMAAYDSNVQRLKADVRRRLEQALRQDA